MKNLVFLFLVGLPYFAISQEPITFTEVIEVSGVDKNELFTRAREWFNETFKSGKDVLQISDKESGELSGKGITKAYFSFNYMGVRNGDTDIEFTVNIWVKDGKYKYEIINLKDIGYNGNGNGFGLITTAKETKIKLPGFSLSKSNEIYTSIKVGVDVSAKKIIEELKTKMAKPSKANEW